MPDAIRSVLAVPDTVRESRVYRGLRALGESLRRAPSSSRLADLGAWLGRVTRRSWLYRWLTKEPEPEVIVIDLRETWTVGPVIAVLDRVIEGLLASYRGSRLQRIATGATRRLHRAPIRSLSIAALIALVPATVIRLVQTGVSTGTLALAALIVGSGLGTLVDLSWPDVRETRPVQLAIAALEPPEPPERTE